MLPVENGLDVLMVLLRETETLSGSWQRLDTRGREYEEKGIFELELE